MEACLLDMRRCPVEHKRGMPCGDWSGTKSNQKDGFPYYADLCTSPSTVYLVLGVSRPGPVELQGSIRTVLG